MTEVFASLQKFPLIYRGFHFLSEVSPHIPRFSLPLWSFPSFTEVFTSLPLGTSELLSWSSPCSRVSAFHARSHAVPTPAVTHYPRQQPCSPRPQPPAVIHACSHAIPTPAVTQHPGPQPRGPHLQPRIIKPRHHIAQEQSQQITMSNLGLFLRLHGCCSTITARHAAAALASTAMRFHLRLVITASWLFSTDACWVH